MFYSFVLVFLILFILIITQALHEDDYRDESYLNNRERWKYINASKKLAVKSNLEFKGVYQCEVITKKYYYTTSRYGRKHYTFIILIKSLCGNYEGFCYVNKSGFRECTEGDRLELGVVSTLDGEEVYFSNYTDKYKAIDDVLTRNRPYCILYKYLLPIIIIFLLLIILHRVYYHFVVFPKILESIK